MNKQYYVREGRRFVKTDVPSVIDHRGEYYNADGSFSKEKRDDSVGVCVIQNPTECIICGLNEYKNVTHNGVSCLLHNFPDWRLGEQEEMHIAIKFYQAQLNLEHGVYYQICLCCSGNAIYPGVIDGWFYSCVNDDSSYVITVKVEVNLLRLFKTVKL